MGGALESPLLAAMTLYPESGLPWPLVPIVVIGLLLLGAPLYVIIGALVVTLYAVYPQHADPFGVDLDNNFGLTGGMVDLINTPELVAIPFFMIAGTVMGRGEIAKRLVKIASSMLGWLPGGLAVSAIAACMFFAAISGSSPVTVITIGAIMVPALIAAGYDEKLSYGVVSAAGGLGIIIPPSIPMVVYAIYATMSGSQVKLDDIFIAGLGPGLIIALLLSVYCILVATTADRPVSLKRRILYAIAFVVGSVAALALLGFLAGLIGSFALIVILLVGLFGFVVYSMGVEGIWSVLLPIFIIAGIYSGVFNAIEASAMSVIFAVVIEVYIHKSLKLHDLPLLLRETAVLMGSLLLIVTVALGLADFMEDTHVPQQVADWLRSFDLTPLSFALLLNLLLLLVGCFLDIISAIVLFVPLVVPIAAEMGLDPVHVGIIFIVNLEIGYLTPPLGINLFVASTYFNKPIGFIVRAVAPFLVMMIISVGLITYIPSISLGILRVQQGESFYVPFPTEVPAPDELGPGDDTMKDMMEGDDVQELLDLLEEGEGDFDAPPDDEGFDDFDAPPEDDNGTDPAGEPDADPTEGALEPTGGDEPADDDGSAPADAAAAPEGAAPADDGAGAGAADGAAPAPVDDVEGGEPRAPPDTDPGDAPPDSGDAPPDPGDAPPE